MSRRHKDNDIEKPLAKGDLVNSNEQNLKDGFENTIYSLFKPGRMIKEILRKAYDGISSIVSYHLFVDHRDRYIDSPLRGSMRLSHSMICRIITNNIPDI